MAMILSKSRLRVTEAKFYGNSQVSGSVTSLTQGTGVALTPNPLVGTGTVAVSSAYQSLIQNSPRWFNVKNPAYGAVGNGITDDSAAFAAVFAAMGATPGVVYMPAGTYVMGAYNACPAGTVWKGDGMGVTTILRKSGFVAAGGLINPTAVSECLFEDFTIDGNSTNCAALVGNELTLGNRGIANRVELVNWTFVGIDAGSSVTDWANTHNCRVLGLGAGSIDGGGVAISCVYGIWAASATSTLFVEGSTFRDCGTGAIYGGNITVLTGNEFVGNHRQVNPTGGGQVSHGTGVGLGLVIATGNYFGPGGGPNTSGLELNDQSVIQGNYIEGQGAFGIILQTVSGSGHVVTGNIVKNPPTTGNFKIGIMVNAGVTDFTIDGNEINDDQGGGPFLLYGIRVAAGASNRYRIVNNRLANSVTANLSDGGTGAEKHVANNGIVPAFDISSLTIRSRNAALPPVPMYANTIQHFAGGDASDTPVELQSWGPGYSPILLCRAARGTAAAPTASQIGDVLGSWFTAGRGATVYSTAARTALQAATTENWTDSAQGTRLRLYTTLNGSTTTGEKFGIENDGRLTNTRQTLAMATPGVIFTQTAGSATQPNVPATLFGTGVGTLTLPANFLIVGTTIRVKMGGYVSTADGGAGTKTLVLILDGVTVATATSGATLVTVINNGWEASATITCRTAGAGGTVIGGASWESQIATATPVGVFAVATAVAACNTTGSLKIDLTFNNGNATGVLTTTWCVVEIGN